MALYNTGALHVTIQEETEMMRGIGILELLIIGGGLLLLLIVAVVVIALLFGRKSSATVARGNAPEASARQILDERLARGEIDADEYDRLRERLDKSPGS
jgi:putative membrane protein